MIKKRILLTATKERKLWRAIIAPKKKKANKFSKCIQFPKVISLIFLVGKVVNLSNT